LVKAGSTCRVAIARVASNGAKPVAQQLFSNG